MGRAGGQFGLGRLNGDVHIASHSYRRGSHRAGIFLTGGDDLVGSRCVRGLVETLLVDGPTRRAFLHTPGDLGVGGPCHHCGELLLAGRLQAGINRLNPNGDARFDGHRALNRHAVHRHLHGGRAGGFTGGHSVAGDLQLIAAGDHLEKA